jgi:hypothetical protein
VTSWDKDLKIPPVVGAGKLVNITQYAQRHPSYFPDVPASAFPYYIERNLTTTYTQYIDTIVETAHVRHAPHAPHAPHAHSYASEAKYVFCSA